MKSQQISTLFRDIARILELKGDNPFRIRAYDRAAQVIEEMGEALHEKIRNDSLLAIPGIGKDLEQKIKEIASTGTCSYFEQLKKEIPEGLLVLLKIPGIGPKTVKKFYEQKGIDSIEKLADAIRSGELIGVEGVREKTVQNILRGIELLKQGSARTPFYVANDIAQDIVQRLSSVSGVERVEIAGSLRRKKETVKDIDILAVTTDAQRAMETFTQMPFVREVLAKGTTKSSILLNNNIQVDLRVVKKKSFGSALLYFTGSKEFNVRLRQLAIKKQYKVNEYGVFSLKGKSEKFVAGHTEKDIFSLFDMQDIPPELREDRGEIAAAQNHALPHVVTRADIKGDFHIHSLYSDGKAPIADIAQIACALGYEYIAVVDHSQGLKVAGGLSETQVYKKIEEIRVLNKKIKLKILCGTEVDITKDGTLDYPDSILREFDLVIAAIHSGFKQTKLQLTRRIARACENKYVHIVAHPTGKLRATRDPYDVDLEEIAKVARANDVALEINCFPDRLDLGEVDILRIKETGVKLALGSDSHQLSHLRFIDLGVNIARRAWVEPKDILNCMGLSELRTWLKRKQ